MPKPVVNCERHRMLGVRESLLATPTWTGQILCYFQKPVWKKDIDASRLRLARSQRGHVQMSKRNYFDLRNAGILTVHDPELSV